MPHIGIFDSGLGGLTVAAAIAQALPDEGLIYLGDTARVPYGSRSPATVVRYARNNAAFLRRRGVKLIVVACNTVSAQGLGGLADGSSCPIIGVIRPGARAAVAASKGGGIAVLGTTATIRSGAYVQAIHELEPERPVLSIACPLLVPLVEEGWLDHPVTRTVVETYLSPLAGSDIDTIILGCTHYPLIADVIGSVAEAVLGRPVRLVDSATAVATAVSDLLDEANLRNTEPLRRVFYVTDTPERSTQIARRFWGEAVGGAPLVLEHVDVVGEQ